MVICPFCEKHAEGPFDNHLLEVHVTNYLELNQLLSSLVQREVRHDGEGVYFVQGPVGSPIKIGKTKNIHTRLEALQVGSPTPLSVLLFAPGSEVYLHQRFRFDRVQGEWFNPSFTLLSFIVQAISEVGRGMSILFADPAPVAARKAAEALRVRQSKPTRLRVNTRPVPPDPQHAIKSTQEYLESDPVVKDLVDSYRRLLALL